MILNKDELTAIFQEMLAEFVPSERAPHDKQHIRREFECKDPEARGARTLSEISSDLILNVVCPRFMADSVEAQGIDPIDICGIVIQMTLFDPIYEMDDNGELVQPLFEIEPAHWAPVFSVEFRPTNGWTPEGTI